MSAEDARVRSFIIRLRQGRAAFEALSATLYPSLIGVSPAQLLDGVQVPAHEIGSLTAEQLNQLIVATGDLGKAVAFDQLEPQKARNMAVLLTFHRLGMKGRKRGHLWRFEMDDKKTARHAEISRQVLEQLETDRLWALSCAIDEELKLSRTDSRRPEPEHKPEPEPKMRVCNTCLKSKPQSQYTRFKRTGQLLKACSQCTAARRLWREEKRAAALKKQAEA